MAASSFPNPYYSDYTSAFSSDFRTFPPCPLPYTDAMMIHNTSSNMARTDATMMKLSIPNCEMNSPVSVTSFPDSFGVSNGMVAPEWPECEVGFCDLGASSHSYPMLEQVEECVTSFLPLYHHHMAGVDQSWVQLQGQQVKESEVKVGRYSVEERKSRIMRYLKKRNQRNFNKTIKYACRKTLADKRVRVRGRFAKNNEACEEENAFKMDYHDEDHNIYEMKYEGDDEWLQAAMASLVCLPYTSGSV